MFCTNVVSSPQGWHAVREHKNQCRLLE
jgi:hypothetical protein